MRILVQRVRSAKVEIEGRTHGTIQRGLLALVGITHTDTEKEVCFLADKCVNLRIFEDDNGKMNRSLLDIQGSMLIVSQFTLYGDAAHGRRPGFDAAAKPELAIPMYERFLEEVRNRGVPVETGVFGADMLVSLENDGPVTLMLEK